MYHHAYTSSIVSPTNIGCMPVGQLDVNTTGLMLFADFPDVHRMVCEKGNVTKFYVAGWDRPEGVAGINGPDRKVLEDLFDSVGVERVVEIEGINDTVPKGCRGKVRWEVEVGIRTGQYHIVKRNFSRVKISLKTLERVGIGRLRLGNWRRGTFRKMGKEEVREFCKEIGVKIKEDDDKGDDDRKEDDDKGDDDRKEDDVEDDDRAKKKQKKS